MELLNDLGKDVALSIILEKARDGKIKPEEIGPFIHNIREALRSVSSRDHAYSFPDIPDTNAAKPN